MDDDFKSDSELIQNAQNGIINSLNDLFINMSSNDNYLKKSVSRKPKLGRLHSSLNLWEEN